MASPYITEKRDMPEKDASLNSSDKHLEAAVDPAKLVASEEAAPNVLPFVKSKEEKRKSSQKRFTVSGARSDNSQTTSQTTSMSSTTSSVQKATDDERPSCLNGE